jgi:RecA-family ATPase
VALDLNDVLKEHGPDAIRVLHDSAEKYEPGVPATANGSGTVQTDAKLGIVTAASLLEEPARQREWLVHDWFPAAEVTLLAGDGGIGKSLLMLQLGFACATNRDWIGLAIKGCPVLYAGAEDDINEVHYRLEKLFEHEPGATNLDRFHILSLAGEDALLCEVAGASKRITTTPLFTKIEAAIARCGVGLLILDAAADMFGGEENSRAQVRAFIQALRNIALKKRCTIVILAHPSVDAMKTERGYVGSTAWNNSVRSRIRFYAPKKDDGTELDPDVRILELGKANRARRGGKIMLRWQDNRFVREGSGAQNQIERQLRAEDRFLTLLLQRNSQERFVSPNRSRSFAPTEFAKHPDGAEFSSREYEHAMEILLSKGSIRNEEYGPPSRRRNRLVVNQQ